ncbi:hypothetical protein PT2222_140422 [Paraburkholderia tropica]
MKTYNNIRVVRFYDRYYRKLIGGEEL